MNVRTRGLVAALVAALALSAAATAGCAATSGRTQARTSHATNPAGGGIVFQLRSPAFGPGDPIPPKYALRTGSASGGESSIPYTWSGAPEGTRSFALSLVDHAPIAREWVHWLVVDIPADATSLTEGASGTAAMPSGAHELASSYKTPGYGGPNPPPGSGTHPYEATLYALDTTTLPVPASATLAQFQAAILGHVLGTASYTGTYSR